MYQLISSLFDTAFDNVAIRISGYKNQRCLNGTVLSMSIRMLPAGRQVLIVTFCMATHLTPISTVEPSVNKQSNSKKPKSSNRNLTPHSQAVCL